MKIKLNLHRQDALVHFHLTTDDGEWFAVACARGVMKALGRHLVKDEKTVVEALITEIKEGKGVSDGEM